MRKTIAILLALLTCAFAMVTFTACSPGKEEQSTETKQEQTSEDKKDKDSDASDTEENSAPANAVKSFDDVDSSSPNDTPLQIESVTLYDDGSVRIVPTEEVLKIAETNDLLKDGAIYPFKDSGKVKDIYLVRFGNGGYRTVICLMDDGSLSALSANDLINEHIAIVMDNVTGRDNYVAIEQTEDPDAFGVKGITEDGEEVDLDFSLDF